MSGWPRRPPTSSLAATDVADLLVRKGMPFREAHGVVGRPGARGARARRGALRAHAGRPPPPLGAARRLLLRGARSDGLARVEGLGGRHGLGSGRRAARGGRAALAELREDARRDRGARHGPAGRRGFFERSVHEVARDLVGCALLVRRRGRGDRGGRELRARRSRLPRLRRAHPANRAAVRPARARLRVPLVRHPRLPQLRLRARGRGGCGADPGARAALGDRGDARAGAGARRAARAVLRARAS